MYNDNSADTEITKELIDARLKELGISGIAGDTSSRPDSIEINLGGTNYKFETKAEMETALANAFSGLSQQHADLLRQVEESQNSKPPGASGTSDNPKFEVSKFASLMERDPLQAFDYIDEMRYGPSKVPHQVQESLNQIPVLKQNLTAYQFLDANPDFSNTNDNASKLRGIADNLGLSKDLNGLNAAYLVGKAHGMFTESTVPASRTAPAQTQTTPSAPPPVSRHGQNSTIEDPEHYLNSLSNEQLLALIQ